MLAASGVCSNVPPQNLQATPVPAIAAVPAKRFGEHAAALVADANPADLAQHEAARQKLGALPRAMSVAELDATLAVQPQFAIPPVSLPLPADVEAACDKPQTSSADTRQQCQWQRQDQDCPGGDQATS